MALAKSQRSLKAWGKQKWRTKSGKPSTQGSKATGERYLPEKQLRLYLPLNTPPLRLLNAKRLEEVNNFLNNPARLQRKHQDFVNTAKLKENLKQERIREKIANDTSINRTNSKSRRNMGAKQNRKNKGRWTS